MLHSHPEYVKTVIFVSLIVSSSPFSRLCRGIYGLKKKRTLNVSHNLPLFLNMFNFFSPFLLLFVFWSFKAGFGRGNGTVTFYFFVLKFLSLADCVFIGCEWQDVVLGSSLPADPTSGLFWETLSRAGYKIQG